MTAALPPIIGLTASQTLQGEAKEWFTELRSFLFSVLGVDGTAATALATLGAPFSGYTSKTSAFSIVDSDRGKTFDVTSGTFSVDLLSAATAGASFQVSIRNSGSGVVTINPNSVETINGVATLALAQDEGAILVCTGSAWVTIGLTQVDTAAIPKAANVQKFTSDGTWNKPTGYGANAVAHIHVT
ncbi:MAG: hypothetical protein HQL97_01325, partial [Magnetococcales bacterium]|nr:hypothetical protein [Magnetococcales bacterium]